MNRNILYMRMALREAEKAFKKGEAPVGALAVLEEKVIARAHNERESKNDPLGHAELLLLKKVSKKMRGWRLTGVTVYVTLEPCVMCMGALLQARVKGLVFGALDPKAGACGSLFDLSQDSRLNHQIEVTRGILGGECGKLLSVFFKNLRRSRQCGEGGIRQPPLTSGAREF